MLYFSLAHCHLEYCIVSWGAATNSVLQPREVVRNYILHLLHIATLDVTLLYKSLNILKLHDIHEI